MEDCNPMFLQLRFFCDISFKEVKDILISLNETTIECIEILMPFNKNFYNQLLEKNLAIEYTKFKRLIFHSVAETYLNYLVKIQNVFYTSEQILDNKNCGQVGYYNFSSNSNHILKSINFNSCLYKKIGIDVNGNIKNCPSLNESIGNILDIDAIQKNQSFSTEKIKKEDIEVCQDCEFRYVCTDCRAYTDSTQRNNARPSKCDYNPYIAKWSHEEGYRTLSECGVISNEYEFSIDHERIAEINKELWGE